MLAFVLWVIIGIYAAAEHVEKAPCAVAAFQACTVVAVMFWLLSWMVS